MRIWSHITQEVEPLGTRTFWHVMSKNDKREYAHVTFERYSFAGARHAGAHVQLHDEGGIQFFIGIPKLWNGWLTIGVPAPMYWLYRRFHIVVPDRDVVSVSLHSGSVYWRLWQPQHEWHSRTPRWRNGAWHYLDMLLGKERHERVEEEPFVGWVKLPEGRYPVRVKMCRITSSRARWPWARRSSMMADMDVISRDEGGPGYVPVPGKGDDAWNCGGDGVFSLCCPAYDVGDGLQKFALHVVKERLRNGAGADYHEPIT